MSVVLPCLNEVESVGTCVSEAKQALVEAGITGEVVVVDNGSTDGSELAAVRSGARVVHQARRGYGSALRAGIAAARGAIVVMADADLTYDLAKVPDLVQPILDGDADLVLGSRVEGATRHTMPLLHRFVGTPLITFLIARSCGGGIPVRDSQSGFRAFRREAVLELGLTSEGMEFASEMLIRARRGGLRIREVSAGYRPRVGQSKLNTWSDGVRHLQLILGLAPDLLLVGPGVVLLGVGIALSLLGLISPTGVSLGSLRWQPVFFSSIAVVLGIQALLGGVVLAHRLSIISGTASARFPVVSHASFAARCLVGGIATSMLGLAIDAVLFVIWITGGTAPSRGLALAAVAQSLIIVGASVSMFAVVMSRVTSQATNARTDGWQAYAQPESILHRDALAPSDGLLESTAD